MKKTLSVIIPTIYREAELVRTVESIVAQTVLPEELIIVDQTPGKNSEKAVNAVVDGKFDLKYIHDPDISGSATARNVGIEKSTGDVVLFLEDDVVLEAEFIGEMLKVYDEFPEVGGVCGVITNVHKPNLPARVFYKTFHRGVFKDERKDISCNIAKYEGEKAIRVTKFYGGLMSFKSDILNTFKFDENYRKYSLGEDVDLSYRISKRYPIVITTRARLEHLCSPVNRYDSGKMFEAYVCAWHYLYRKNFNDSFFNRALFLWLNVGFAMHSVAIALLKGKLFAIKALLSAYEKIANDFKGCDFLVERRVGER